MGVDPEKELEGFLDEVLRDVTLQRDTAEFVAKLRGLLNYGARWQLHNLIEAAKLAGSRGG